MMNWRRSILAIASIVSIGAGVKLVIACADSGDPADMYVSFFQNNITAQPQYQPFYFTEFTTFHGDEFIYNAPPEDDALPDANIEEWYSYTVKAAKKADIDSFMYKYTYKDLKAFFDKKTNVSAEIKNNTFCKFLAYQKNSDAMEYLLYAKRCEPLTNSLESYWDEKANEYKNPVRDTGMLTALIKEGADKSTKTKNDFLKWRYTYQVLRLAFYNGDNARTLKMYDKLVGSKTAANVMYPRCLSIKAGALYRTGNKKQAAYLYSKVFDLSDDMKRTAMLSFIWATGKIKMATLQALCKTKHEKAVMLVMDGLHEREAENFEGLGIMEKAYALDPAVKGLDIIMTREINKAEQRYMQPRDSKRKWTNTGFDNYYSYTDSSYERKEEADWKLAKKQYIAYLAKLNKFALKLAADKKLTTGKAFWYMSASYINFMSDKFADSKKYLDLAAKEKMTLREHDMHDVLSMICIVKQAKTITAETEAQLLPCVQWVEKRMDSSYRFSKVYRDFLFHVLTAKYMDQKDTVKAVCCLSRMFIDQDGDFSVDPDFTDVPGSLLENMSIDRMHEIRNFMQKKSKTGFEEWLTEDTPYPVDVLKELEGTRYIRELKFDKAVAVLSTISGGILSATTLPDIMVSHLKDSQEWNKSDSAKTYNKLEFAKKMASLQKTLETQPRNGRVAYQYANGLYSMSYYGRAHHAVDYYRCTYDESAYYATDARKRWPASRRGYYDVSAALKYYQVAFNNTSDYEMKARCLFLAAKCWQKNCPVPAGGANEKTYYLNSLENPYFGQLYNQYSSTKLYREAISTCVYFKDYVKKQ